MKQTILSKRYQILRKLGEGATGKTFLCMDTVLQRRLVVKISEKQGKLLQEGRRLASLSAYFYPKIYEYEVLGDTEYLFLEYIEGENLRQREERINGFTQQEIIHISIETARAISYLHNCLIPLVYGDLKPENVMIRVDGQIMLIDFETVCEQNQKLTIRGGTKEYAAPEYWCRGTDLRNDIFSYGKLLNFLIDHSRRAISKDFKREIVAIIERCLQKNPNARYQSMSDIIQKFESISTVYGKFLHKNK